MTTEIKAGQRWEPIARGHRIRIEWADGRQVLIRRSAGADSRPELLDADFFRRVFRPYAEPTPRYITKEDIMKMLAEYGVIYSRVKGGGCGKWVIAHVPEYLHKDLDGLEISPNPFAPNPVIIGPEIEVVE